MYICRTNPFAMLNDVNDVLNDELVKSSLAASRVRVSLGSSFGRFWLSPVLFILRYPLHPLRWMGKLILFESKYAFSKIYRQCLHGTQTSLVCWDKVCRINRQLTRQQLTRQTTAQATTAQVNNCPGKQLPR